MPRKSGPPTVAADDDGPTGPAQAGQVSAVAPAPPHPGPGTPLEPIRKKDFVARTVDRAGIRKADARAAIDAALQVLAESLEQGQDLILPPLGKIRVVREKIGGASRQFMLRVTLARPGESPSEPLAEPEDHG